MPSLFTNEQLPKSSEEAIRVFDERYLAAVSMAQPPTWATELGDVIPTDAPRVTFPISQISTKYIETRERTGRFKTPKADTFDVKTVEFDAGYEADYLGLTTKVWEYRTWTEYPKRFLLAEARHINKNIVTLLEDGTNQISPWDKVAFFSATHKCNPTGDPSTTFSNYQSVAADVTDITKLQAEVTAMMDVRDENGEKYGVYPDTILVPTPKHEPLKNMLAKDMILEGSATAPTTNPYRGRFNVIHVPEFTDVNDWYLVDSKLIKSFGISPWTVLNFVPPKTMGLRYWDETSDFFKDTSKIKVSSHIWYGFALVFPHAIRKVVGA